MIAISDHLSTLSGSHVPLAFLVSGQPQGGAGRRNISPIERRGAVEATIPGVEKVEREPLPVCTYTYIYTYIYIYIIYIYTYIYIYIYTIHYSHYNHYKSTRISTINFQQFLEMSTLPQQPGWRLHLELVLLFDELRLLLCQIGPA